MSDCAKKDLGLFSDYYMVNKSCLFEPAGTGRTHELDNFSACSYFILFQPPPQYQGIEGVFFVFSKRKVNIC